MNFNGGFSSIWSSNDAINFFDAAGTYQLLWSNSKLKKFIFLIPNKANAASTTLSLGGINNPYPYQR